MSKFKVGDKIRMKEDCDFGKAKWGEMYLVMKDEGGDYYINSPEECNCQEKWELVTPKTLENIEFGDVVVDKDGYERKVLGRLNSLVFLSDVNDFDCADVTYTVEELKKRGFTLKQEPEDKEEVINIEGKDYTVSEIKRALGK